MSINSKIENKVYGPTDSYLVGREKIREFAKATKASAKVHYDLNSAKNAGYSDLIAPPTFAIIIQEKCLQLLLEDEEAQLDFSRVVHGAQEFQYQKEIIAGDSLTGEMKITKIANMAGNYMVTSECSVINQNNELVLKAISTLVIRGE